MLVFRLYSDASKGLCSNIVVMKELCGWFVGRMHSIEKELSRLGLVIDSEIHVDEEATHIFETHIITASTQPAAHLQTTLHYPPTSA